MRRACVLSLIAVAVLGVGMAPAAATKPIVQRPGVADIDLHFPATVICDFPVDVHLHMNPHIITFVDANGDPTRGFQGGLLVATEVNAKTGTTLVEHLNGPSFFDATGALVSGRGTWGGVQLQDGTWVSARGNITFDANSLIVSVRGRVIPLCPRLA